MTSGEIIAVPSDITIAREEISCVIGVFSNGNVHRVTSHTDYVLWDGVYSGYLSPEVPYAVVDLGLDADAIISRMNQIGSSSIDAVMDAFLKKWNHSTREQRASVCSKSINFLPHLISDTVGYVYDRMMSSWASNNDCSWWYTDSICVGDRGSSGSSGDRSGFIDETDLLDVDKVREFLLYSPGVIARSIETVRGMSQRAVSVIDLIDSISDRHHQPGYSVVQEPDGEWIDGPVIISKKRDRKDVRRARKALRKGISLFSKIFGENDIRSFLSGESFTMAGFRYDYRLVPRGNLIQDTIRTDHCSIPYGLEILHKSDGSKIGSICVVYDGLPVIDQLLATCLHLGSDDTELELLKTGNIRRERDNPLSDELKEFRSTNTIYLDSDGIGNISIIREPERLREVREGNEPACFRLICNLLAQEIPELRELISSRPFLEYLSPENQNPESPIGEKNRRLMLSIIDQSIESP